MTATTLFDKIWAAHQVAEFPGRRVALAIDRLTLHELNGASALRRMLNAQSTPAIRADQVFAVADHSISTSPERGNYDSLSQAGSDLIATLEKSCGALGYRYARPDEEAHGIVHVAGPEQGFIVPGTTHVCGDSHTCTLGAFGTLGFAVGSSEIATILRHSALIVQRPKSLRVTLTGKLGAHVSSKDVALRLLAEYGIKMAVGYVIEFAGPLIGDLSMEARMTLCNMAAEMGTRYALIGPDETTFAYLREVLPVSSDMLTTAIDSWQTLRSDEDALFDRELSLNVDSLVPQVSWGSKPMLSVGIDATVPEPSSFTDNEAQIEARQALDYMQLQPGERMTQIPIDAAFIGSCTNARLSDLRAAAEILRGRKVAKGVRAMCTPGSMKIRAQAEREGLDAIFRDAGFSWRKSGCSNCAGREGPIWDDMRVISSTNRNFENRQGHRTRTHLASPATVAASAVTGRITDPRTLARTLN
jgi:3-isopropylmalate/(R)-2-methylmalate dehydratase large subunit